MDTKLKNSKFIPIIKLTALLLTIVFAFLAGTSTLQLIRKTVYFNNETENFNKTPVFIANVKHTLNELSKYTYTLDYYGQNMTYEDYCKNSVSVFDLKKDYDKKLEKALFFYEEIQQIKKVEPKNDGSFYDEGNDLLYDKNGYEYAYIEDYIREYPEENRNYDLYINEFEEDYIEEAELHTEPETTTVVFSDSEANVTEEVAEKGNTATTTEMPTYNTHAVWEYDYSKLRENLFSIVSDARSTDTIKTELNNRLNDQIQSAYENDQWEVYVLRERYENVEYFIQDNKTGNYFSNFENINDIKNLKENYKENALYYFLYDGKKTDATPIKTKLNENILNWILTETGIIAEGIDTQSIIESFNGYTVYFKINPPKIPTDDFFMLHQAFIESIHSSSSELKIETAIFGIICIICAILLVFLQKPKHIDGAIKLSLGQRTLFIIKFILYLLFFISSAIGIGLTVAEEYMINELFLLKDFAFLYNENTISLLFGILFTIFIYTNVDFIKYIIINKKAGTLKNRFICYKIHSKFKSLINKNKNLKQTIQQIEKKLILIISGWLGIELLLFSVIILTLLAEFHLGTLIFAPLFIGVLILGIIYTFKFLGDIKSLAIATEQMKNGIYANYLAPEKFIYPLKEFAYNLNECRNSIEHSVNEALKGERLKTELITNVSHDLKTPLTSIINYVSLLKLCNIEGEDENKYLEILDEKSKKLQRLIEDLTEASKATSGNIKMNFETVNLNELALQAVGENNDILENVGLEVIITQKENELYIKADSKRTFRIFDNLFSNVKKYALTGTRIYVDVYKEGTFGVFSIKNISKEKLNINPDELTERFIRGDNSRTTEGSGLGLSIARSFTELQNGKFSINIDGDLFKVVIKLPLSEEKPVVNINSAEASPTSNQN